MEIFVRGVYHKEKAFAEQDKKYLEHLFGKIGSGMETVFLSDWKEYRATHNTDTDNFTIEKATPPEVAD